MVGSPWECLEEDAFCTEEMITRIGLGKEVMLLVECYTPRAPSAIGPVDLGIVQNQLPCSPRQWKIASEICDYLLKRRTEMLLMKNWWLWLRVRRGLLRAVVLGELEIKVPGMLMKMLG